MFSRNIINITVLTYVDDVCAVDPDVVRIVCYTMVAVLIPVLIAGIAVVGIYINKQGAKSSSTLFSNVASYFIHGRQYSMCCVS